MFNTRSCKNSKNPLFNKIKKKKQPNSPLSVGLFISISIKILKEDIFFTYSDKNGFSG